MDKFLTKSISTCRTLTCRALIASQRSRFQNLNNNIRQMSTALNHSKQKLCSPVNEQNVNLLKLQIRNIFIEAQATPNPNSLKFIPDVEVLGPGMTKEFPNAKSATDSPLAKILFGIEGVKYVFFGPDFITVIKMDDFKWQLIKPEIIANMIDFFGSGQPILSESQDSSDTTSEDDDELIQKIKDLMDSRIRPRAQEDGGDLIFMGFDNGILKLKMRGTCTSCPNSVETLKNGVLNMMQFYVPEVVGVERVEDNADKIANAEIGKLEENVGESDSNQKS